MPDLAMEDIPDDDLLGAGLDYLYSVMLFPTDETARARFLRGGEGEIAASILESGCPLDQSERIKYLVLASNIQDREFARAISRKSSQVYLTASREKSHPGLIAAQIILMPFIASMKYGRDDIGKHATFNALGRQDTSGSSVGKRNFQSIWHEFHSVSHIWAAYLLNGYDFGHSPTEIKAFFSLAAIIQKWGQAFKTKRSNEFLLDSKLIWDIPPSLRYAFVFDLTDLDLDPKSKQMMGIESAPGTSRPIFLEEANELQPDWIKGFRIGGEF